MAQELPSGLSFPGPPFRTDQSSFPSSAENAVANYLNDIRRWRSAVLDFMSRGESSPQLKIEGLTDRARSAFSNWLASDWSQESKEWALQSAYNLDAFPADVLSAGSSTELELVYAVLRWRAGVCDCLSDVWNVIGDPWLELDECSAIMRFLDPADHGKLCCFCLNEFPPARQHFSQHDCPVIAHAHAKWPVIERFDARATAAAAAQAQNAKIHGARKRWWSFWRK